MFPKHRVEPEYIGSALNQKGCCPPTYHILYIVPTPDPTRHSSSHPTTSKYFTPCSNVTRDRTRLVVYLINMWRSFESNGGWCTLKRVNKPAVKSIGELPTKLSYNYPVHSLTHYLNTRNRYDTKEYCVAKRTMLRWSQCLTPLRKNRRCTHVLHACCSCYTIDHAFSVGRN